MMNLSEKGKQFIKNYESLKLKAYQCETQKLENRGNYTIGYGYTGLIDGKKITKDTVITKEKADSLFVGSIKSFENCVNKYVKVPISQTQFDALVSLCYNIGCNSFISSTLLKELNGNHPNEVPENFPIWNHISKTETSAGLTRRRLREACLFVFGEYR